MGRIARLRERRKYNVQELHERHHQMIRLRLLGRTPTEISEILGVTPQNVSDVLSGPLARDQLAVLKVAADCKSVDIAHMLTEEAPECLRLLRRVRDADESLGQSVPLGLRVHAAESLLDRHGLNKIQNIRGIIGHAMITDEILEEIKGRVSSAREEAKAAGVLIELPNMQVKTA